VLFSHAATLIALVQAFTGDLGLNIQAGCCSISELVKKKGDNATVALGGYETVMLVSGAHLQKGSEREWGFDHVVDKGNVVEEPGVPGSEDEEAGPVGLQVVLSSHL